MKQEASFRYKGRNISYQLRFGFESWVRIWIKVDEGEWFLLTQLKSPVRQWQVKREVKTYFEIASTQQKGGENEIQ
jgi:hypothetical protein